MFNTQKTKNCGSETVNQDYCKQISFFLSKFFFSNFCNQKNNIDKSFLYMQSYLNINMIIHAVMSTEGRMNSIISDFYTLNSCLLISCLAQNWF